MNFFDNHKQLFLTAFLFFTILTLFVAIIPALRNQRNNAPLPGSEPLSEEAVRGKAVFVANGCVACHTQQVRNVQMDNVWGGRPGIAADYAAMKRTDLWRNTATLMGTERTGPDLTSIGERQPSRDWHLVHLFNPRAVVPESVMPSYPWLFEMKAIPAPGDVVVRVPDSLLRGKRGSVVAQPEALQLVAYLQSLKQTPLPDGRTAPPFLYQTKLETDTRNEAATALDGATLYATHCQSCHQAGGEGLPGAFPPLKGSPVVLDDNPEIFIDIIMNGYNARADQGYGPMPAVGTLNNLSPEEITAIANHERSSWGNNAPPLQAEDVKKIIDFVTAKTVQP